MTNIAPATIALNAWKQAAREGDPPATIIRKWHAVEVDKAAIDEERRTVPFIISSAAPDRENDTIDVNGWRLDNYRRNPVVLWAHDSRSLPIAKAIEVAAFDGALRAVDKFATRDEYPFADTVFRLILGGYLNATSVGFLPLKWRIADREASSDAWFPPVDFLEQELLEHSVVPVPANPEALVDAKAEGIDLLPIFEWAVKTLDEWQEADSGLAIPRERVEQAARLVNTRTVHAGVSLEARLTVMDEKLDRLLVALASFEDAAEAIVVDGPPATEPMIDLDAMAVEEEPSSEPDSLDGLSQEELRRLIAGVIREEVAAVSGRVPD